MHKNFLSKFSSKEKILFIDLFVVHSRALLAGVTDEIKANKLADTNIINDLLGFSSESQVRKMNTNKKTKKRRDSLSIKLDIM